MAKNLAHKKSSLMNSFLFSILCVVNSFEPLQTLEKQSNLFRVSLDNRFKVQGKI